MHVIITGGSGLIGRALTNSLAGDGHEVIILSRAPGRLTDLPQGVRAVGWDSRTADGWGHLADGATAIVNLAAENLAGDGFFPSRWTAERKQRIRQSRLDAGRAVVQAVEQVENKPGVLVQASAVGYYGTHEDEVITEEHPPGDDFLAELCVEWEESTAAVKEMGVRQAIARTGLVLSTEDGSLPRVLLPYKLFVGGPFGNGQQWWSWIHLQDEVRAMRFLIDTEAAQGPFNLTAPEPLTNDQFGRTLGRVLGRPHYFPVPGFLMRALFGEVSMVVLEGQRVIPRRLQELGFDFNYEELQPALQDVLADGA
ncbi:MAG TPA: TIGR01777 family oxidoreductase [Candidatus Sulfomarinibacteraceae bacterium]|nr:TIGR01777 family oxidoreductase [Candidatus Sulfomarinibacteraceae bacterium]